MGIVVRKLEWRTAECRPIAMASVYCPFVHDINADKPKHDWMGITHCNACSHARKLIVNYEDLNGEVHCAAPI